MARKRYLIVGDGAAGLTAAEELRRREPAALIGIFTDEPNPGYFRAALTNFLLGELREDQLWAVAPNFYEEQRIERIFTRVLAVDAAGGRVFCSGNPTPLGYDALLIASGARARPPTFPGAHLPGILTLRTLQDARRLVDQLRGQVRRALIVGGGPLGLEWVHALLERGVAVTLLERAARLLPNALDAVASDLLASRLRQAGVEVLLGDEVACAEPSERGALRGVVTKRNRRIPCDILGAALGIIPNGELLEPAGVARTENGAVVVDRRLRSSAPSVWAAGDVASVEGEQLGLWAPAREQGRVAAANMAGANETYAPGVHYFATRLFDLDFARLGSIVEAPGERSVVDLPRGTGHIAYRKLLLSNGKLKGALLVGERKARVRTIGRGLKRLMDADADVSRVFDRLLDPSFDVEGFLGPAKLLAVPEARRSGAQAVVAAKLRGTQALGISALDGSSARAQTALGRANASDQPHHPGAPPSSLAQAARTAELALARQHGQVAVPAGGGEALSAAAPRSGTRLLSIGLPAEAPAPPGETPSPNQQDARLEHAGRAFDVARPLTRIGAAPECEVNLVDGSVAHLHAQIQRHAAELYVRDVGTQSGTWLNGLLLTTAQRLCDGDRIVVGRSELVFRSLRQSVRPKRATTAVALPRLELRSGPNLGLSFALGTQPRELGSGARADIRIVDASVAPQHARVRAHGEQHYLTDLGGPGGTYLRSARLAAGQEVALTEGDALQLGRVVLVYTRSPALDGLAAFRPRAELTVSSGHGVGYGCSFVERALVGSAPTADLCLPGLEPYELELVRHHDAYFVRDLSGGRTFRGGVPLASAYAPLAHGELLLVSGGQLLRFEEA